jgi:predicted ATPase
MQGETLSDSIQRYLRIAGYSQQNLATTLGLHPVVLSRKLHGKDKARLTQKDIKQIVLILVEWRAITTRAEVFFLLDLAQLKQSSFSQNEWQSAPLNQIEEIEEPTQDTQVSQLRITDSAGRPHTHTIPASVTQLIGRVAEMEHLHSLIGRAHIRLVTLVGSGGCGKTRLALEVALMQVALFTDGVWFISLADINDPAQVAWKIIQELDIPLLPAGSPQQRIIRFLQHRKALLVIDNFEHVQAAASLVSDVLRAASAIKILITSRVSLRLYGEYVFRLPLLELPDLQDPAVATDPSVIAQYGAVQLFVERVQEVVPDFTLTANNGVTIAQICACLDGLPLALELAAARITLLAPSQLLERLSTGRLSLLRGGARDLPARQQTLRAMVEWSYLLLNPIEQRWFARLAVFSGGCSLDAVTTLIQSIALYEQKKEHQPPVSSSCFPLELLEALVRNSLLERQQMADEQVRLTMLETLREYALECLGMQGELELLQDLHACYYLQIAEATGVHLQDDSDHRRSMGQLEQLELEYHNFRTALVWVLRRARVGAIMNAIPLAVGEGPTRDTVFPHTTAAEIYQRLTIALRPYWEWRGDALMTSRARQSSMEDSIF